MLRSYQYTEQSYMNVTIHDNLFREKETEITHSFVSSHPIRREARMTCPLCGDVHTSYFYTKWNVDYMQCEKCKSVFAVCEEDIVQEYQDLYALKELRAEDAYQTQITSSREDGWREIIDWISFRAFRFLGKNRNLKVVDYGNRYRGYVECIRQSPLCGEYNIRESIIGENENSIQDEEADILLYLDQMQKDFKPTERLRSIGSSLREGGLLILGTRAGSGFDIVTLREHNEKIYPYEHILLPSVKGLVGLLEETGFEVLEITTPGVMDIKYVVDSLDKLDDREGFVRYLLSESDPGMLNEFQRFLQKGCLSSFVRLIAKKCPENEKTKYAASEE